MALDRCCRRRRPVKEDSGSLSFHTLDAALQRAGLCAADVAFPAPLTPGARRHAVCTSDATLLDRELSPRGGRAAHRGHPSAIRTPHGSHCGAQLGVAGRTDHKVGAEEEEADQVG